MSAHLATQQAKAVRTWSTHDAAAAAQSFKAAPFNAVWWGHNSHAHTIIGSGEVSKRIFRKEGPKVAFRRERFDTPDADFIDVDFLDPVGSTAATGVSKIAVLTHGLESSSDAPLTSKMALAFARRGYTVAVLCFRSCSGEDNLTLRAYHMGFTDDLKFLVEQLRERHPSAPIFLSGFSLGGNVICKYLGEMGTTAKDIGILGAAVACVPFDAVGCQKQIDSGFNKAVYSGNFLKTLIPKINRKAADPKLADEACTLTSTTVYTTSCILSQRDVLPSGVSNHLLRH
eukprot:19480-Heterococcus_DN1.PRE.2